MTISSPANTSLAVEHFARFKGMDVMLGRPRKPKRIVQNVLSESEISRLIQATRNPREKAIISLLAYSGIRNSELCAIRRKDIDLGDNRLKVRRQGQEGSHCQYLRRMHQGAYRVSKSGSLKMRVKCWLQGRVTKKGRSITISCRGGRMALRDPGVLRCR